MAGDWIKMRAALMQSPRLVAMVRELHDSEEHGRAFRDWLTPGGGGPMNGQIVSDDALRCVTMSLLLRVWSSAREFGKWDDVDLILDHITPTDLSVIAGAPGVGEAMVEVGWAVVRTGRKPAIILPNFKQHNVPMTDAERQAKHRDKGVTESNGHVVTKPLPEKRREYKKRISSNSPIGFPEFWTAYPNKVGKKDAIRAWVKIAPDETLRARILQSLAEQKRGARWLKDAGAFIPNPASWLNGARWEDEPGSAAAVAGAASNRPEFAY